MIIDLMNGLQNVPLTKKPDQGTLLSNNGNNWTQFCTCHNKGFMRQNTDKQHYQENIKIEHVYPELTSHQLIKLYDYVKYLCEWNGKINLISRKNIDHVVEQHIIPCLSITRMLALSQNSNILDIGTGGGLPGIPLAICYPYAKFRLIDSIGKKIMAVNDMIKRLELMNAVADNVRAETIHQKFDVIVARAVTNLSNFLSYASPLLKPNGRIVYIRGMDCHEELQHLQHYNLYSLEKLTGLSKYNDKIILEIFQQHHENIR